MRPSLRLLKMKVLCVAEKNSIAKSVAQALGGGRVTTRDSPDRFVKNYDISFNFPEWGPCTVTVTSVRGHLTSLKLPDNYANWSNPPPDSIFNAHLTMYVSKDMSKIESNIKKESRGADKLFIWTDCDREGEHIGHEIVTVAKQANYRLSDNDIKRAMFNNTDPDHLVQAALRPINLDLRQVDAVEARREFDLRTGFAFTRFQSLLLKKEISRLGDDRTISYGSCQFPTLGFVVDRYRRIKNFVPEPFWYLELKLEHDVTPNWARTRLFDRLAVLMMYEKCMEGPKFAEVLKVSKKPTSKWRPLPLTTVELQKCGATYLKISSKKIMDVAESLYNAGYISYPRTETDSFDDAIDLKSLVRKQFDDPRWSSYAQGLLNDDQFKKPRQGKHNDKAHPPIHPVRSVANETLKDETHRKVYEFITRHFLACCGKDATGESTNVQFDWNGEKFNITGIVVKERNFLEVYPYMNWTTSELPAYELGQLVPVKSALMRDGKTAPPGYMTESELIALMDANGIGTDATMAEHIEKILDREYIVKQRKGAGRGQQILMPSSLGIALVEAYDSIGLDMALTKPFLRKEMEEKMSDICRGSLSKSAFLRETIRKYHDVYNMVDTQKAVLVDTVRNHLQAQAAN